MTDDRQLGSDMRGTTEPELTAPVSLTGPDGRLNRAAVGFARSPLVDTDGIGRGVRGRGRNKRWEYWNVITPAHIVGITVSSIDYAAVHEVWIYDRATGEEVGKAAAVVPPRGVELPGSLAAGLTRARARNLRIDLTPLTGAGPDCRRRSPAPPSTSSCSVPTVTTASRSSCRGATPGSSTR
ncbi:MULTISPECIES: DUF2804 family protein [Gordonia]|jgi:hypothetical protein|nr:DUF2804 family protein [Gordonia sp. UBA5067]